MATINLTKELFEERVAHIPSHLSELKFTGKRPAVVDFYASWCAPCRQLSPLVEELSDYYGEKVDFYKVDVEKESALATFFGVRSIPTLVLFSPGGAMQHFAGAMPKTQLKELVDKLL
jgi:thioredoxin